MDMSKMGIVVSGLVSDIRSYPKKDTGEIRHTLRLFVPGSELISVGLAEGSDTKRFPVGQPVKVKVNMGSYNGKTFFNEASPA